MHTANSQSSWPCRDASALLMVDDSEAYQSAAEATFKAMRRVVQSYLRGTRNESEVEDALIQAALSDPRYGLGSEEAVTRTGYMRAAKFDELEALAVIVEAAGLPFKDIREQVEGCIRGEEVKAIEWRDATIRLRTIHQMVEAGDRDAAGDAAISLLRDTWMGDDRAEQRIVELLDHLGLDDAIIRGFDILRERRREIYSRSLPQLTHAVGSWGDALTRIAEQGGPLSAEAERRLSEPFYHN